MKPQIIYSQGAYWKQDNWVTTFGESAYLDEQESQDFIAVTVRRYSQDVVTQKRMAFDGKVEINRREAVEQYTPNYQLIREAIAWFDTMIANHPRTIEREKAVAK